MSPLTLADHILFALFAFALPLLMIWRQQPSQIVIPEESILKIRIYWLNSLVLWIGALVIVVLWLFYDRAFTAMGIRLPEAASFPHWLLLIAGFILFYMADAMFAWTSDEDHPAAAILPANWKEFAHFGSVVSLSAAICEEIVFRGFLVTYLLVFLEGHPYAIPIAVVGSALVFGIVHAYQGWAALLKITLLSMLFAGLFILTKSLLLLIALHFVVDFCSGMMAVIRSKEEQALAAFKKQ